MGCPQGGVFQKQWASSHAFVDIERELISLRSREPRDTMINCVAHPLDRGLNTCKRSQECHEGTNLAHMGRKADHAHIAVGASVVATHLITSSAWKRRVGGIVSPRAWAVLRLMISSNFIGCNTGRSAGLAPFRSLST
jgi:hypothetical protein